MSEFTPITLFPNFIFIPKIVPLVYDDALSYYEFLNKVLVKLNEMIDNVNDLGVDVEELKTAVEQLSTLIGGFDDRISSLESNAEAVNRSIDNLNNAMSRAYSDIEDLKAADISLSGRIDAIETQITTDIAAAVAALETQIGSVSADVGAMGSQVNALDGRVTALESATYEAPIVSDFNFLQCNDIQHLDNFDYEIVRLSGSDDYPDAIQTYNGYIRFTTEVANNPCALVIHNVLPYMPGTWTTQLLSFGCKYRLTGSYSSQNGTDYCVDVPFSSLTGSTPYIANSGYSTTRASLRVLALKLSRDGKSYDLYIYNNYNSEYHVTNQIDIYGIGGVFKSFAGQSMSAIKQYWATVYGHTGAQVGGLIKKHAPKIINDAVLQAYEHDTVILNLAEQSGRGYTDSMYDITVDEINSYIDDSSIAHDDLSGVSINAIQNLNSDITVDYSNTKYGISQFNGTSFAYETWSEEIRLFINVEVTITGSGAVNTNDSIPVVNISNTLGATIPSLIPLTIHAALPAKAPFVEAYLHTNGNVIFRCWFDDTNYNYTDNPIKVRIAGFVPLSYTASAPD